VLGSESAFSETGVPIISIFTVVREGKNAQAILVIPELTRLISVGSVVARSRVIADAVSGSVIVELLWLSWKTFTIARFKQAETQVSVPKEANRTFQRFADALASCGVPDVANLANLGEALALVHIGCPVVTDWAPFGLNLTRASDFVPILVVLADFTD